MTPDEAAALVKRLRAAYPEAQRRVGGDTAALWLDELLPLDAALGEQAVRSLITSARRWPSIAELHEQLEIARRQAAEARRNRERQEADEAGEELDEQGRPKRPKLADIPTVQALLGRWSETFGLPEAEPGECEDCKQEATARFVLGTFTLCRDCVRSRKAAGAVATGGRVAGSPRQRDPAALNGTRRRHDPVRDARPSEPSRSTCRICGAQLRAHERAEGECDECLRGRSASTFPGTAAEGGSKEEE